MRRFRKIPSFPCYISRPLFNDEVADAVAADMKGLESYDLKSRLSDGLGVLRIRRGLFVLNFEEVRTEHF
jgi:hypothetical protein